MDEARELENSPSTDGITGGESGGYYTGSGRSEKGQKGKGKSFLKKGGPIGAIIAAVLGVGIAGFGSQSFQGFSLVNNIMSNYGSSSYSTTARLTNMINKAISKRTKVKVSPELEEAGDSAGLKFNADADGNLESVTVKSTSTTYDASNIEAGLDGSLGDNVAKAGQNVDIQSSYTSETKTKAASRIDWEKNRYADYDSDNRTTTDAEAEFKTIAEGETRITEVDSATSKVEEDEDGKSKRVAVDEGSTEVDGKNISSKVSDISAKASKVAQGASTVACAFSGAATAVAAIVIAQQITSMINMSSGYMESIQKVQAGVGDGSSLHQYENATNQTASDGTGFWTSTSIASLFGGDTGDDSAGIANLENVFTSSYSNSSVSSALTAAGATVDAWKACIGMKIVANTVDVIGDIIGIFTAGIGKAVQLALSAAISVGAGLLAMGIIEVIVDAAVAAISVDPVENMGSEEAGDYTVSGGNIILSAMGRSMGQSAGTSEKVAEFNAYKDTVIARLAEYDRDNLSPFDTSSQYTFLGSLKYSLIQFSVLNSSNSVLSFIKSAGTIVSNSVSSLLPTSNAYEYSSIVNLDGDCPIINSAEGLGTALHCNYVSISDPDSFDITYEDAVQYLLNNGQLEGDIENHTVVKNSELAKYITFWTVRDSHLGLADSGITNSLVVLQANTDSSVANTAINGAIGVVPVAGAALDIVNATIESENYEYIFGAKYVAGGKYWNEDKELMENIQAFLELDTIYSDLALIETSTLATYLDEYYEENPLDNSYEGKLARFSGLSKDQVVAVLDLLDYADLIANYDSTDRYKFFEVEPETEVKLDNSEKYVEAVDISLAANRINILYADPRTLYTTSA